MFYFENIGEINLILLQNNSFKVLVGDFPLYVWASDSEDVKSASNI